MSYRLAILALWVLALVGCGRWEERQIPSAVVTLADGESYAIELWLRDYREPSHAASENLSKEETVAALAGREQRATVRSIRTGAEVLAWSGRPGHALVLIQRYRGQGYVVARRYDPTLARKLGELRFFRVPETGGGLQEIAPTEFPPELAYGNVTSSGMKAGDASAAPGKAIAAATPISYPYFQGDFTGALWDTLMTGDVDADYRLRPGYAERLLEFQKRHGRP